MSTRKKDQQIRNIFSLLEESETLEALAFFSKADCDFDLRREQVPDFLLTVIEGRPIHEIDLQLGSMGVATATLTSGGDEHQDSITFTIAGKCILSIYLDGDIVTFGDSSFSDEVVEKCLKKVLPLASEAADDLRWLATQVSTFRQENPEVFQLDEASLEASREKENKEMLKIIRGIRG